MKKYIYKNIVGNNPRRKEVSIEESENRFKTRITRKRSCKYFIKSCYQARNPKDLERWLIANKAKGKSWKNCNILKSKDSRTGEIRVICKVIGEFFVVHGLAVFKILYVNSLKVKMDGVKAGKIYG